MKNIADVFRSRLIEKKKKKKKKKKQRFAGHFKN